MQPTGATEWDGTERRRVQAVIETLTTTRVGTESLAEVAHDARNLVTALGLYCDLLDSPGVLTTSYRHFGSELRLVTAACRRLVERVVSLDAQNFSPRSAGTVGLSGLEHSSSNLEAANHPDREDAEARFRSWNLDPPLPIEDLARELFANRNLLSALAGPGIQLNVTAREGSFPVQLTSENLTRILVNLVKNAAEAMPGGGAIDIVLGKEEADASPHSPLLLTVEDSGSGIPEAAMAHIFEAGFSTHLEHGRAGGRRGLGLSITRSIVETAGGTIHAENRPTAGARFRIQLPLRLR